MKNTKKWKKLVTLPQQFICSASPKPGTKRRASVKTVLAENKQLHLVSVGFCCIVCDPLCIARVHRNCRFYLLLSVSALNWIFRCKAGFTGTNVVGLSSLSLHYYLLLQHSQCMKNFKKNFFIFQDVTISYIVCYVPLILKMKIICL